MKRLSSFFALSAVLVVACAAFGQTPHGRFVTLPPHGNPAASPAGNAITWVDSYKYNGGSYNVTMIGTDPSKTNTTTTVTLYLIPVNICVTVSGQKTCFDPKTQQSNGATATTNVLNSPIFKNIDYVQSGTDIGTTQYEDAFQRANFWTSVMTNTNYHVLLKVVAIPEVTVNVPSNEGTIGNPFGDGNRALVDINYIDEQINAGLPKLKQVNPSNFPLVMTYNTYLTEGFNGECCIGGYHSAFGGNGSQAYGQFTYVNDANTFSADVSAMSHEIGEWMDDPFVNNNSPCGIYEVGDPIETETATGHHYGDYTYTLNGFTYHVQDLATTAYFGESGVSNNNNWTFQGQTGVVQGLGRALGVCSNGP